MVTNKTIYNVVGGLVIGILGLWIWQNFIAPGSIGSPQPCTPVACTPVPCTSITQCDTSSCPTCPSCVTPTLYTPISPEATPILGSWLSL